MKITSFHEYMDSKRKISAPVVKTVADLTDPKTSPNKPKDGPSYKYSDGKPKKGSEKGLACMGDEKLKYTPDIINPNGKEPAKLPTAEAIQRSRQMVQEVLANPTLIEHFVKQMKDSGLLGALVAEVFSQKESAMHLTSILTNENYGPRLYRNLNQALNEEVSKPFSAQLQGEEEEEGDEPEDSDDMNVDISHDDPNMMDPSQMDPNMAQDPSQMANVNPPMMQDPSQMGMDPNAQDPNMMPPPSPTRLNMKRFQRLMMRAYQRAMMGKN